jgi:serine/threonine protein kinase
LLRSPEVLEGESYDAKCDVWGLGCVLYEMASFTPPFVGSAVGAVVYQILQKEPPPLPNHLSPGFRALVSNMLVKNPLVSASLIPIPARIPSLMSFCLVVGHKLRPDIGAVLRSELVQSHMIRLASVATFQQPQLLDVFDAHIGTEGSLAVFSRQHLCQAPVFPSRQPLVLPEAEPYRDALPQRTPNTLSGENHARQIFFENQVCQHRVVPPWR